MKNKWLIGIATAALAVTLSFGLAACGGDEEDPVPQDVAQSAINLIKRQYGSDAVNTVRDYQVLGEAAVGGKNYTVEWSALPANAGMTADELKNYVSLGEMDATTKLITVSITADAEIDVNYTLKASVTAGGKTATAEFPHTIPHNPIIGCDEQFDFSSVTEQGATANGAFVYEKFKTGALTTTVLEDVTAAVQAYTGNSTGGAYQKQGGFLRLGSSNNNGSITLVFSKKISSVTVLAQGWSSTSGDMITVNGADAVAMGADSPAALTFTLTAPTETVTISTANKTGTSSASRGFLFGVGAMYATDVHNHEWVYEHIAGTFTHKQHCVAANCDGDFSTEQTVDCTPRRNVCKCGYTYKEDEILDKFFALTSKTSLPGTYELTGTVTKVDEIQTSDFQNATFYMKVGTTHDAFEVYRAYGEGYENIKPGDTVTVYGELTNYSGTYEVTAGGIISSIVDNSATLSDQAKADFARDVLTLDKTTFTQQNETGALPATGIYGAAITWSIPTNDYIEQKGNNISVKALPQEGQQQITITATVKVGTAEATQTFTITVQAPLNLEGKGTQDDPYTVEDAKSLAERLASGAYYEESGSVKQVYVEGYIADPGSLTSYNNVIYAQNVLITSLDGSYKLKVYRFYFAEGVLSAPTTTDASANPLHIGDYVVVYGFIQNYQGNSPQVSYNGSTNPTIAAYEAADTLSNAEKAALAIKAFDLATKNYNAIADTALPATEENFEATLTWGVKEATNGYVTVENNTLKITSLPETDTVQVVLTVTATVGDATSAAKEITITLSPAGEAPKGTEDNPYTVAEALAFAGTVSGTTTEQYYVTGYVIVTGTWSTSHHNITGMYIADDKTHDKNAADAMQVYGLELGADLKLFGDLSVGSEITVKGFIQNGDHGKQVTYSNNVNPTTIEYTDARSADEKAQAAADGAKVDLKADAQNSVAIAGTVNELTLPVSTVTGVTLSFEVSGNGAALSQDGAKLTFTHTTEVQQATLSIKANGTVKATVTLSIAIGVVIDDGDYTYDLKDVAHGSNVDGAALLALLNPLTSQPILSAVDASYISKGAQGGDLGNTAGGVLKLGTSSNNGVLKLTFVRPVSKIVITARNWNETATDTISVNGAATVLTTSWTAYTYNFVPTTEVTITFTKRGYINKLVATIDSTNWTDETKITKAKAIVEGDGYIETNYEKIGEFQLPTECVGATLTWSVKNNEHSDIATISESHTLSISTLPADDTQITLIAHIACGEAQAQDVEIEITIVAAYKLTGGGTVDSPYTVTDALFVTEGLTPGGTDESFSSQAVYVQGYVVDTGSWNASGSWSNVYIADDATHTKDSDDALLIFALYKDNTHLQLENDLAKGMQITLYGYLQRFRYTSDTMSAGTPEMSSHNSVNVTATAYTDTRTEQQKAQAAIAAAKDAINVNVGSSVTSLPLPVSTVTGVTLSYEATKGTVEGNNLSVEHSASPEEVTLTIKAACGSANEQDTVTLKIAAVIPGEKTVTWTASEKFSTNTVLKDATFTNGELTVDDVTLAFGGSGTNAQYYTSGSAVRWYAKNTLTVSVGTSFKISMIVLTFGDSDGSNKLIVTVGEYNEPTWVGSESSVTFTVDGTSGQRRLASVSITYAPVAE